ncbi:MAG: diaminopropionate ammonia-lyase [Sporolactobacillus sp.]|uniref:diaminopropionate ammonia-lyase n=1 Tax=Sporolactobacillus nakayamae TaxID=269670 RepID=UPI001FE14C78|nr:diaminopropionate ammonia-lyase [Sporolactobacillus nakayamae]
MLKTEKNKGLWSHVDAADVQDFSEAVVEKVLAFQKTHKSYRATPLRSLDALAGELGVSKIYVKDESYRFGLNAFKVMGGIYAIANCLAEKLGLPIEALSFEKLKTKKVREQIGDLTFISATDGNHGRGIAWIARELGLKSVIRMPKGSSQRRLESIQAEGADVAISDVNYDDTVRICEQMARENGYLMIQDTSWPGYEEIPLWIMQGYAAIAKEISDQLPEAPTHIFLQAGVGSYAGGISGYFLHKYPDAPPKIILVEPNQADCYFKSFEQKDGAMQSVGGDMATIMAGLACGEPNRAAYAFLSKYSYGALSCSDDVTALGMRIYGNPLRGDDQVISGESGAVTMGALYLLCAEAGFAADKNKLAIDDTSRILLISTEGDTDKQSYHDIVWKGRYPNLIGKSRDELNV